jgi:cell division protein FtsI/penicillin-binding protein 2
VIEDRYVPRGMLLDRANRPINTTEGARGTYERVYQYPELAPITGYNHPIYGQSGIEASVDEYLRGLRGNPSGIIWWNHLLYGMSPNGLDVRLSLDLSLQAHADELMADQSGAVILLNAQSGEILVMSSHPTFDPSRLNEIGGELNKDPDKPLINRAAQGLYPTGTMLGPFEQILFGEKTLTQDELQQIYERFGFTRPPRLRILVADPTFDSEGKELHVSPLQMALASAAFSNHGTIPAPRIATAVNTPNDGWVVLPALSEPFEALPASAADDQVTSMVSERDHYWTYLGQAESEESPITWFVAGTPPNWQATPLVVVVLLEDDNPRFAQQIGRELLLDAMIP